MKINHLLYMDDLKLYSKKESDITDLVNTVKIFSDDIRMKLGYEKCARVIIHRGKVQRTEGMKIGEDRIRNIDQEGYKYLGIMQHHVNLDNIILRQKLHAHTLSCKKNVTNSNTRIQTPLTPSVLIAQ